MSPSVADQVYDIVAKQGEIDRESLTPASTLKELGLDSLEAIEAIFEIEEHFNINFPERDPNLDGGTLGGLIGAVEKMLADSPAPAL